MSKATAEQLQVINHDGGNILVSASAGSGKTHTMIERIKRLIIEENVSIKEILAVTFTEASAADMKEKIRAELTGKVDNIDAKRLKELIDELPTADVCTMHSFCGKLIRTYFFACGVAPDFKIIDQSESTVLRVNAVEKTFKEFYDAKEAWFSSLIDRHATGRMDTGLKELVLSIYAFCDSEANPDRLKNVCLGFYDEKGAQELLKIFKEQLNFELGLICDQLIPVINAFKEAGTEKAFNFAYTLYNDINALIKSEDVYAIKGCVDYKLKLDVERKLSPALVEMKEKASEIRAEFVKIIKRYNACLSEDYKSDFEKFIKCKEHTENLMRLVNRFSEIYEKEKRDENVLDFNDLEHFALKILLDEEIRKTVSDKYKYIFVDEYQDTNGVQEEIILKLSSNNLFMVGDVKQSIYGFRGCRSEFFTEKDKKMSENGEKVVRLNSNFRSARAVINFVNLVFNFCMTEKVYGENYKGRSELEFGGIYPDGYDGRAELHFLENPPKEKTGKEQARIYDLLKENQEKDRKGGLVPSMIASIIEEELKKKVFDTKKGCYRPVEFGDIAILTRNRNGAYVKDLVSGLIKSGVPVSSSVSESILDYPEIKMLVNVLKLIDCFYQDLPLASTLKSPVGGFTDEEIFDLVRFYDDNEKEIKGTFIDAYAYFLENGSGELKEKLIAFDEYIKKVRLLSDFIGANGVIKKVVEDKNIEGFFYAKAGGEKQVERLKMFVFATLNGDKTLTVREFLSKVENCPDAFALAPFSEENTVKVTTIHSSKGLEYPVVIVCGLEKNFNEEEEREDVLLSRDYGVAVKYYDDELRTKNQTLLRGVIRSKMRRDRIKEEMRLFYVALTRATYSLHLVFTANDDRRKSEFIGATRFLDFIPSSIGATVHTESEIWLDRKEAGTRKVLIVSPDDQQVEKMKSAFSFRYPFESDTRLPLKGSVTKIMEQSKEEFVPVFVLFEEESPDTESGTIAHKLLEHYDFSRLNDFDGQIEQVISKDILSRSEINRINLSRIKLVLSSGAFNELSNKKLYREQPFLVDVCASEIFSTDSKEKVTIQGVIDLLVIDGDYAEIIDYKYSALTTKSLKEKYKKQLDLYAYAVEKVLGKKVKKKTLINIFTGETVNIE